MNADFKLSAGIAARSQAELSFWRMFGRHCRTSVRYYGLRHTVMQIAEAAYRFFREFLPGRRKAKYGDLDYDFDRMVDTTRANVSFRAQLTAALSGHQYFPTEPWLFEQIMQALPIDFQEFTFVDLGSGKGRVLLMAAPYGFKRIVGVEFMPEWHRIAVENIGKFAIEQKSFVEQAIIAEQKPASVIESLCKDARDFDLPAGPLVVYLFNPFPEPVLAAVLGSFDNRCLQIPGRCSWRIDTLSLMV
ncbi:MAG: hypothetical protein WA672_07470 [Candidatus Angelobacter sp.]